MIYFINLDVFSIVIELLATKDLYSAIMKLGTQVIIGFYAKSHLRLQRGGYKGSRRCKNRIQISSDVIMIEVEHPELQTPW